MHSVFLKQSNFSTSWILNRFWHWCGKKGSKQGNALYVFYLGILRLHLIIKKTNLEIERIKWINFTKVKSKFVIKVKFLLEMFYAKCIKIHTLLSDTICKSARIYDFMNVMFKFYCERSVNRIFNSVCEIS